VDSVQQGLQKEYLIRKKLVWHRLGCE
jgi:hypothetical protein